ncbi:MAG: AmmeMemoRadiSam system radical SAM enzyme [Anaerolineales bacterium]
MTLPGELYETLEDDEIRCVACGHRCLIRPGRRGICQVRFNQDGELRVPWGYVAALQSDPIEKKPFNHFMPGSDALTFGMLGCDFHCGYCQNWLTSQALRDSRADAAGRYIRPITPEEMIQIGQRAGSSVVASSYNEPLITSEWAKAVFTEARRVNMKCVYVSNGNFTPEVLDYIGPYLDGLKIDLKSMQDKNYRQLGGVLEHVLSTIRMGHEAGLWVEVVTLLVPGFNDETQELMDMAHYIRSVSVDIPWHVTAFHPDYEMTDQRSTTRQDLIRAAEIGMEAGLRYVYAGNMPGSVDSYEDTLCPHCNRAVIRRTGYLLRSYDVTGDGRCRFCQTPIAGVWPKDPKQVRLSNEADFFHRGPRIL